MPQLDPTFFPTQLFWLFVTFTLLFLVVWKVALPRIAGVRDARRSRIDTDLEKANALKEEAEEVHSAYERSKAEATNKAHTVHRNMADELLAERNAKLDEVAKDMAARLRAAEEQIAAAERNAETEISSVAAELVQSATSQLGAGNTSADEANAAVAAVRGGSN